MSYKSLK